MHGKTCPFDKTHLSITPCTKRLFQHASLWRCKSKSIYCL